MSEQILGPPPTSFEQKQFEETLAKIIYMALREHRSHPTPHHLVAENYVARAVRNALEARRV